MNNSAVKCVFVLLTLLAWSVANAKDKLNGIGVHSELGSEQFMAALYVSIPTDNARNLLLADEEKVMELRILADKIYARRFKRIWLEGIAINAGSAELQQHAQHMADFANLLKVKLRAGDILRIERNLERGVIVTINGYELGNIPDKRFFDLLLRTWVGPVPLSSEFKEDVLSAGSIPEQALARFQAIEPTRERVNAVIAALEATQDDTDTPPATAAPAAAVAAASSAAASAATETVTPPQTATEETDEVEDSPETPAATAEQVATTPAAPGSTAQETTDSETSGQTEALANNEAETALASTGGGLLSEDDLFEEESILDDDEEEFTFTAEDLLSQQLYYSKLTKWTRNFVKYPRKALQRGYEGTVRVTATINRDGKVTGVEFMEKSEHDTLNEAAESAVRSASPYPAMPEELSSQNFVFTVPVVFKLR